MNMVCTCGEIEDDERLSAVASAERLQRIFGTKGAEEVLGFMENRPRFSASWCSVVRCHLHWISEREICLGARDFLRKQGTVGVLNCRLPLVVAR